MSKNIGLFFGAGAEIAYGMPSGGQFALDIFKSDATAEKKEFRKLLESIDTRSKYASKWLPMNFQNKTVSAFGKTQYEQLMISSLEHKRIKILNFLNNFDSYSEKIKRNLQEKQIDIDKIFENVTSKKVGDTCFTQDIQLNAALRSTIHLFDSRYFSALLNVLVIKHSSSQEIEGIKKILKSFIELLIGAVGEEFLHELNDSIFEKKPDDIDIFDDFCGFFSFEYNRVLGLDIVLSRNICACTENSTDLEKIEYFAKELLEEIFAEALDYQSLIDSYYSYLFKPKTEWGKFCKICIFLMTVHKCITKDNENIEQKLINEDGFYKEINELFKYNLVIGTSNYNKYIEKVVTKNIDVFYLNGNVDDFYDPYKNKILDQHEREAVKHIHVPLLFTQSGIKPLTSVEMSRRYVDYYDKSSKCSDIFIIGYGCNADDSHINGLFRELIEEKNIRVHIFDFDDVDKSIYAERLRVENDQNLSIIKINKDRKTEDNKFWYEKIIELVQEAI